MADTEAPKPCPLCKHIQWLGPHKSERMCGEEMKNAYYRATGEAEKRGVPTIKEMSGLVPNFTGGKTMKEYMEELSDE